MPGLTKEKNRLPGRLRTLGLINMFLSLSLLFLHLYFLKSLHDDLNQLSGGDSFYQYYMYRNSQETATWIWMMILFFAVLGVITNFYLQRRNWARIATLVASGIMLIILLQSLYQSADSLLNTSVDFETNNDALLIMTAIEAGLVIWNILIFRWLIPERVRQHFLPEVPYYGDQNTFNP